jgi:DNA-binding protein H-NS
MPSRIFGDSMSSLIDLQFQIEKLQKQANEIKAKEFSNTVQDIVAKMQAFGITVKDLQSAKYVRGSKADRDKVAFSKTTKSGKAPKKSAHPVAVKYRGPNGETWSGRGLTPKWLAALVAQGQSKDAFLIA